MDHNTYFFDLFFWFFSSLLHLNVLTHHEHTGHGMNNSYQSSLFTTVSRQQKSAPQLTQAYK